VNDLPERLSGVPSALRRGFRIEAFLELLGWKTMEITPEVPRSIAALCPADASPLRTLCTFTDAAGATRMRLGCCSRCGHISYIDRPSEEWVARYYLETWDAHDLGNRAQRRANKVVSTTIPEKTVVTLAKSLDVDRERPVCEIGCGWGASLRHLQVAGFSTVVGTEASAHRADTVRAALAVPVFTAPFESAATQSALAEYAPFSVIVTNHVLEHTYAPDAVIARAAQLQREGDYLIVAVPNQQDEPVMGILMFLPHLHSFTRASLERLAARHGYALVDDTFVRPRQLVMTFRKAAAQTAVTTTGEDAFERAIGTFSRRLDLGRRRAAGLHRLWWSKRGGDARQRRMAGRGRLENLLWNRYVTQHHRDDARSIAVRSLRKRATSPEDSPFEIQFPGPVALFYK
jgi:2-polyprenyl-3-methyl-5-hydroxy-6-metoxy-1,4-benzoquinol methylase